MSYQLDCFDNIIGLSRTLCSCYDSNKPADYNTSLSGLYLDELMPLTAFKSLLNCENGNEIWTLLDRSREQAILNFRADANALLLKNYKLKRKPFYGHIGKIKYSDALTITTGDWVGIRIFCADVVSGVLKIKNIGALFSETGSFTLYIYNNMNELVDTVTINTVANTHTSNDIVDIELDLHSDYVENLEYYLIYQKNGLTPKNNIVDCLSCPKYTFDTCNPIFKWSQTNKQYGWAEYCMVGSFKRTDISDLSDLDSITGDYMYGLTLEVELKCKIAEVWCKDELDFESNPIARAMALAIRFKSGELFLNDVMLSSNINYERLINGEAHNKAREIFAEKYAEMMEYISENVDVYATDCFECKDDLNMGIKTILI